MSANTNREEILFTQLNIKTALQILSSSQQGKKVRVEGTIDRSKRYLYSNMLPNKMEEFFVLKDQLKWITTLRAFAPHTIIPQRVLNLRKSKSIAKSLVSSYNLVYGDSEDQRIFFYNLNEIDAYKNLASDTYQYGILGLEYRIDVNRFIIECLLHAQKFGAEINVKSQTTTSDDFDCYRSNISGVTNAVRICEKGHDFLMIPQNDTWKVFQTENNTINSYASEWFAEKTSSKQQDTHTPFKSIITSLKEEFGEEHLNKLSKATDSLQLWNNSLPNTQELTTTCDYKYDLYKETGISKQEIKKLFFTYGHNIDEIAEVVYELINKDRSYRQSGTVWTTAEQIYRERFEWGDKAIRISQ